VLEEIGFTPFLHLKMRLGEGTGAVLAMQVIEAAVKILSEMRTFEEAGVAKGKEEEVQIEEVDSV
jgi:nicotinate-nucleotide--dimethylbenzimidazole phosphoribosyltransferase